MNKERAKRNGKLSVPFCLPDREAVKIPPKVFLYKNRKGINFQGSKKRKENSMVFLPFLCATYKDEKGCVTVSTAFAARRPSLLMFRSLGEAISP